MIIGGLRLFGRVDENRAGYVVTKFFHLWFVPIVPLGSFFVSQGAASPIPLSARSIFAAYVRAFGVVLALGCTAGIVYQLAFGFFSDLEIFLNGGTAVTSQEIVESIVFMAVLAAGAAFGVLIFLLARFLRKANASRCGELSTIIGRPVAPI